MISRRGFIATVAAVPFVGRFVQRTHAVATETINAPALTLLDLEIGRAYEFKWADASHAYLPPYGSIVGRLTRRDVTADPFDVRVEIETAAGKGWTHGVALYGNNAFAIRLLPSPPS